MKLMMLAAGVAALAISAPVAAKPDKAGGGQGRGGAQAAKVDRGGGGQARAAKADRGPQARVQAFERRGGGERRMAAFQPDRGSGKAQRSEVRARGKSDDSRLRVSERRQEVRGRDRIELRADKGRVKAEQRIVRNERVSDLVKVKGRDRVIEARDVIRTRDFDDGRWDRIFGDRGVPAHWAHGCPPGLAKKTPACIPPGQARNLGLAGALLPAAYSNNLLPLGLRDLYRDDDDYYYRYGDGYVYRVNRGDNLVDSLLPLIGAGLGIGQPFPYSGAGYYVPSAYQPFYPSYGGDYYRYANGYAYEVDGRTGLIENVIPLLDRGYGVGQMLPASYSTYNVPYQYRDLYYDTPDYAYRYAPGAIYQVDRDTQLITAIASLLTGGMSVGQQLPLGYSTYNVPLAYRSQYYDTPDAWYRYNDGYIYQVDPTTRLITAIVQALV